MKRSEMMTIIGQQYTKWDCGDHREFPNSPALATMILDAIEKAGMLPPNDGKKISIKRASVPCVMNALNCFVWEEE